MKRDEMAINGSWHLSPFYIANKSLLKWYYAPETNSWKSNYTRPSTQDQLRLLVTLPHVQLVRGCINPIALPAIFNKPTFVYDYPPAFTFDPCVYGDYLLPWRVLIEGRADNRTRTPWELMDEYTLDHFSARAHVYFSYPRHVKYIRITVQDWYGNTLMDDSLNDYFYAKRVYYQNTTSLAQGERFDMHSSIHAIPAVRSNDHYTVRRCLAEGVVSAMTVASLGSGPNLQTIDFALAKAEWEEWRSRTIQSIWKGIAIPPFLFFGDNGEDHDMHTRG